MKMHRRRHECAKMKLARWQRVFPFLDEALSPLRASRLVLKPSLSHTREVRASARAAGGVYFNTPSREAAAGHSGLEVGLLPSEARRRR